MGFTENVDKIMPWHLRGRWKNRLPPLLFRGKGENSNNYVFKSLVY